MQMCEAYDPVSDAEAAMDASQDVFWKQYRDWIRCASSGCSLWKGPRTPAGYGAVRYAGRIQNAHRVAWMTLHGSPDGKFVRHQCRSRLCVNPRHLYLSAPKSGWRDWQGEGHPSAKLKTADVLAIRRAAEDFADQPNANSYVALLAEHYGVAPQQIKRVIRREQWKHI